MNLADAIRKAAQQPPTANPVPIPTSTVAAVPVHAQTPSDRQLEAANVGPTQPVRLTVTSNDETPTPKSEKSAEMNPDWTASSTVGGIVRLELFLGPEELASLFRQVVAGRHTVMTLREAASFLRLPTARLESMAQTREVPAFLMDGKWRFSRTGLEEWMTMLAMKDDATPTESTDVSEEEVAA